MSDAEDATGREEIWLEKYRPQTLDDVAGQEAIVERLQSYVKRRDLPHMLFAGPAGIGKCATGETPVLTSEGLRRIEDVVGETDGFTPNERDTEILTFTDSGAFEYAAPSHFFGKEADELVAVTTRDGGELTVTPEHRFLVLTHEGLEWREAEELDAGERIVRPLEAPLPETDSEIDWLDALDGERTFVHVSETFAREQQIPFEENLVGIKKEVIGRYRRGEDTERIADQVEAPRATVQAARREFRDADLSEPSTVCSLSYLRELDISTERLREHVQQIQYVTPQNKRSEPITPPWELDTALARFLGLAIGEARIERGRIKFYNTDETLLTQFTESFRALFGLEPQTGDQQGVPYVAANSRTLTHYLESCFECFDAAMDGDGIGSAILRADEACRRSFLQAVFDAEAHVTEGGILELTQKNEDRITLLAYLLAGLGIPSRRKHTEKRATNGSDEYQTYHTLYISGASHLTRFRDEVGFSVDEKSTRLDASAQKPGNPNNDTVPTQAAVTALCRQLNLDKTEFVPTSLNPDSPGRDRYLDCVSTLVDTATDRLETVQEKQALLEQLRPTAEQIGTLPARWDKHREQLEPVETRKTVARRTGIGTHRLLEYASGETTPYAGRVQTLLSETDDDFRAPPVETVQTGLEHILDTLDISYADVADGTPMRGPGVSNLLERDDHAIQSTTRFETVVERLETILSEMASTATLEHLRTLHRLTEAELYLDEVETVDHLDESRHVYDLTVPGTRNYVAGTVPTVMHNTTCSVAVARELYGEGWEEHFLELNASDERGIDVVRDRIKSFARTSFGGVDYRIIFLDEADALCVPPGTEVVTGYPSSPEIKKIEDVDGSGEPIPSVDFETNEIQSDKGRLVDSGVADFFELELEDGRTILASLSHPFFVVGEDGRLVEKELRELEPGDEIADFKDDVGVSPCETCGDWTAGRFCSVACKDEGHSREMRGDGNPMHGTEWSDERREKIVEKLSDGRGEVVSDGGPRTVQTTEVRRIEYSHRGKAYNISMENTPNFMLANGILTHNTSDAQSALRRTMEQFSNNVRFIMSCNYSSQIIDPIQSRCAVFRFSPLSDEAVTMQVRRIAELEDIELTDDGVEALIYAADGDMRKAINGLQAAAVTGRVVDEEAVFEITSTARPEEIKEMVTKALDGDFTAARSQLDQLITEEGIAGGDIIDQLHRSVWEFDLGDEAAVRLLDRIGEADYRITAGANERIQLEALLASLALSD